jgi:hypothetical protein
MRQRRVGRQLMGRQPLAINLLEAAIALHLAQRAVPVIDGGLRRAVGKCEVRSRSGVRTMDSSITPGHAGQLPELP